MFCGLVISIWYRTWRNQLTKWINWWERQRTRHPSYRRSGGCETLFTGIVQIRSFDSSSGSFDNWNNLVWGWWNGRMYRAVIILLSDRCCLRFESTKSPCTKPVTCLPSVLSYELLCLLVWLEIFMWLVAQLLHKNGKSIFYDNMLNLSLVIMLSSYEMCFYEQKAK